MKHIICICSYNSTTGTFTVPPGGDGYYYFSAYFVVWFYQYAVIDIQRNGQTLCTAFTDKQYPSNYGQSTCSAAVYATEGLYDKRRMHSSRMHNARLLSVFPSMHCFRGGSLSLVLGGSAPEGCLPLIPGGGSVSQHAMGQTPL